MTTWLDRDLATPSGRWLAYSELMSGGEPIDRGTTLDIPRSIISQFHWDKAEARRRADMLKPQVEAIYA